jgi:hypothetical protein
VKVTSRQLKVRNSDKLTRYSIIKVGSKLATVARFVGNDHRCNVLLGSKEDAGKLAISLDDTTGKFVAKKRANDGRYEIVVREASAKQHGLAVEFAEFEAKGAVLTPPGLPPVITFTVTPEFLGI